MAGEPQPKADAHADVIGVKQTGRRRTYGYVNLIHPKVRPRPEKGLRKGFIWSLQVRYLVEVGVPPGLGIRLQSLG